MSKRSRSERIARRYKKHHIKNATPAERIFRKILKDNGISFEEQKIVRIKNGYKRFYIIDFYIHNSRIGIELDGKHHEENQVIDTFRTKEIEENTCIIIYRFKNSEIYNERDKVERKVRELYRYGVVKWNNDINKELDEDFKMRCFHA